MTRIMYVFILIQWDNEHPWSVKVVCVVLELELVDYVDDVAVEALQEKISCVEK